MGDGFGTGFGGATVSGLMLDRSTLTNDGLGVTLRMGERARVRVTVGSPSVSSSCRSFPAFTYIGWSWNWMTASQEPKSVPQQGPIDMTVVSCSCRLFGEPYWNDGPTGGTPHWEQRAWLDGTQTLEFEIRAVSPGSTSLFISGYPGPPFTSTNPVSDYNLSQFFSLRASTIP